MAHASLQSASSAATQVHSGCSHLLAARWEKREREKVTAAGRATQRAESEQEELVSAGEAVRGGARWCSREVREQHRAQGRARHTLGPARHHGKARGLPRAGPAEDVRAGLRIGEQALIGRRWRMCVRMRERVRECVLTHAHVMLRGATHVPQGHAHRERVG